MMKIRGILVPSLRKEQQTITKEMDVIVEPTESMLSLIR